jgi:hypothetical protein
MATGALDFRPESRPSLQLHLCSNRSRAPSSKQSHKTLQDRSSSKINVSQAPKLVNARSEKYLERDQLSGSQPPALRSAQWASGLSIGKSMMPKSGNRFSASCSNSLRRGGFKTLDGIALRFRPKSSGSSPDVSHQNESDAPKFRTPLSPHDPISTPEKGRFRSLDHEAFRWKYPKA